ncbi:hypothetical protein DPEC_G00018940 [Dallia pectoralis]|uniref:Uncharacterized protein n=1 Tax=Dallia pectoralis TaxID=75939 RepID=A0ACC2HFK8_DALPE|nr:hypothetical protein DPEC_G00018940 [Dallia pectoralis]
MNSRENSVSKMALVKVMEATMATYFKEADEKSEDRFNRLEKRIDNMHATLSRHAEEIRNIRTESVNLWERTANVEKSAASCLKSLLTHEAKLTEMEDRARRDNLLIFNLKEGTEGANVRAYLMEKIVEWFPALESSLPGAEEVPSSRETYRAWFCKVASSPDNNQVSTFYGPRLPTQGCEEKPS